MARTVTSDQVPREECPEHAGTARDQHRAFGVERPGNGEHQLADMAGTTEESIGVRHLSDVPGTHRKRTQLVGIEQRHQLAKYLLRTVRTGFGEIERSILNTRMPCRHLAGVSDVYLAHLDESPAARQESQRCIDEFSFQAIEYDVHALPVGYRGELLLEFDRARVRDVVVVEPHAAQGVPFARAGSRKDLEAPVPGQLHRSHANPACGGVY